MLVRILAIDIGAGTEDVLLYDDERNIENCVKMVLPSPSRVYAEKVRTITQLGKDLLVRGDVIGGGAFTASLKEHLKRGLRVVMTEGAAYTVRNDLDEVRELGIEIIKDKSDLEDFKGETLQVEEVNLGKLQSFLAGFNEDLSHVDAVAVAVQDHGVFPKGTSNRRFRLQKMKEILEKDPRPESLAFKKEEIPHCFLRMRSASEAVQRQLPRATFLVMDTSPAAILGCLKDSVVEMANSVLAVNVGNGHTMAAVIAEGNVIGIVEHHTRLLTTRKAEQLLRRFADGTLSDEEVFEDDGHGLFFLTKPPGFSKLEVIAATGPNRNMLSRASFRVHFAAPAGDVMMTGPIGLVEAAKRKLSL